MDIKKGGLVFAACSMLLLFYCLSAVQPAWADEPVLRIAIPPEGYPPYIITNTTPIIDTPPSSDHISEISGIMVEVLRTAATRAELQLDFRFIPEIRSQMMLDSGTIDARTESPKWVSNPEEYLWSEPITTINDVFVYCDKMPNYFESDEEMAGAEIITHLGYSYPTLEPLFRSQQMLRDDRESEELMLNAILQQKQVSRPGVIRATVMDILVARWLIASVPKFQNQFNFSKRIIDSADYHFQFSRNERSILVVDLLNQHIREMRQSGEIERMTEKILVTNKR